MTMKVLVTCPPMIAMKTQFLPLLKDKGLSAYCPEVIQTLTELELIELVPGYDGWIIGDDPATTRVFAAGREGRLKAAVKWGIGIDNVDFAACERLGIAITNTPGMFGNEVADIALGYVIGLARETYLIDKKVKQGQWPKNRGISLAGKKIGVVGYGDVGMNLCRRLVACRMDIVVYDPNRTEIGDTDVSQVNWPEKIDECDFLVFTCSLTRSNYHMLDSSILKQCKPGVRIVNVARGPLINEESLVNALDSGHVHSAALDVFEEEPLSPDSSLRKHDLCIFGSHNSSNTTDAVSKTNIRAIDALTSLLEL